MLPGMPTLLDASFLVWFVKVYVVQLSACAIETHMQNEPLHVARRNKHMP